MARVEEHRSRTAGLLISLTFTTTTFAVAPPPVAAQGFLSKAEYVCATTLGRDAYKLAKTIVRETMRRRDADTDCTPGTCSNNPTHRTGDPTLQRFSCSTRADCGVGTCVDACPSGRCVPLYIPELDDPEDGVCAAGPTAYHCSGANDVFRQCTAIEATGSCSATCSVSATPCQSREDCPSGEACAGAGLGGAGG